VRREERAAGHTRSQRERLPLLRSADLAIQSAKSSYAGSVDHERRQSPPPPYKPTGLFPIVETDSVHLQPPKPYASRRTRQRRDRDRDLDPNSYGQRHRIAGRKNDEGYSESMLDRLVSSRLIAKALGVSQLLQLELSSCGMRH
jgi:hypothetical protein